MQNNESNQDRFESRGAEAQSGRGGRYIIILQRIVKYLYGLFKIFCKIF